MTHAEIRSHARHLGMRVSMIALLPERAEPDRPQLWVDCGVDDHQIEPNRRLHAGLDAIGYPHTYVEHPGGHT